eukprot:10991491-Lingulodinium_polyedra.AAC.1
MPTSNPPLNESTPLFLHNLPLQLPRLVRQGVHLPGESAREPRGPFAAARGSSPGAAGGRGPLR